MSDLKNPMRWSISHKTCDIEGWLDHQNEIDDVQRRVTEIDIRPGEGNIYVHWEEVEKDHTIPIYESDVGDGVTTVEKMWVAVYADKILLQENTRKELQKAMNQTRVPDGVEICALPKPHGSVIV